MPLFQSEMVEKDEKERGKGKEVNQNTSVNTDLPSTKQNREGQARISRCQ